MDLPFYHNSKVSTALCRKNSMYACAGYTVVCLFEPIRGKIDKNWPNNDSIYPNLLFEPWNQKI